MTILWVQNRYRGIARIGTSSIKTFWPGVLEMVGGFKHVFPPGRMISMDRPHQFGYVWVILQKNIGQICRLWSFQNWGNGGTYFFFSIPYATSYYHVGCIIPSHFYKGPVMWPTQCHKPTMTGDGSNPTEMVYDLGMLYDIGV